MQKTMPLWDAFAAQNLALRNSFLSELKEKNMFKQFTMDLAGRTLRVDIGRVAAQANGAAFMHYGDTVVLCTATASDKP